MLHKALNISGGDKPRSRLQPLLSGRPVALLVNDAKTLSKKRVHDTILYITPLSLYGADRENYMFSMQGNGCEIVSIKSMKKTDLWRVGLSMRAAKLLLEELNELFNVD